VHPYAELIKEKILSLRPKLMDTSRRNSLINNTMSARATSFIRIVDEKPQNIFDKLVNDEAKLVLSALPSLEEDPLDENNREFQEALQVSYAADNKYREFIDNIDSDNDENAFEKLAEADRELKDRTRELLGYAPRITSPEAKSLATHARNHGIEPSFELPAQDYQAHDERHEDNELQTLVLKKQLDARLARIRSRDITMSEERGLKTLYLTLGFLVWKDPASSDPLAQFKSPLILLPITLDSEATSQGKEFSISSRDDPIFNPVLKHKLSTELGIELWEPENQFTDLDIEKYFSYLMEIFSDSPGWRVSRQAVIGVYPFQGIELYNDINPEELDFSKFDIISQLFSRTNSSGEESSYQQYTEEDIETDQAQLLVPKLVVDADSSQFLSLMKVASGQNIALEGPPGSGKSQTIVNLIANAISQNKKVLFVAQKGTALEVVLSRMAALNLDSLVLPLMGRKGDKEKFYEALQLRLSLSSQQSNKNISFEAIKDDITAKKNNISRYIGTLKSNVAGTSITVHQVLGLATAKKESSQRSSESYAHLLPDFSVLDRHLDIGFVERISTKVESWGSQLLEAKLVELSVWPYLSGDNLDHLLLEKIASQARVLQSELALLINNESPDNFDSLTALMTNSSDELSLSLVAESCRNIPNLKDSWLIVINDKDVFVDSLNEYLNLMSAKENLTDSTGISWELLSDLAKHGSEFEMLLNISEKSQMENISHDIIVDIKKKNIETLDKLQNVKLSVSKFESQTEVDSPSLQEMKLLSVLAAEFPILRDPKISHEISSHGIDELMNTAIEARDILATIKTNVISIDLMPSRQRLFEMHAIVRDSGSLSAFSAHFRKCKKECNAIFGSSKFIKSTAEFYLSELLDAQKAWNKRSIEAIFGTVIDKDTRSKVIEVQKSLALISEKLAAYKISIPEFLKLLSPTVLSFFDKHQLVFIDVGFNWSWGDLDTRIATHEAIIANTTELLDSELLSTLDKAEVTSIAGVKSISSTIEEAITLSSKDASIEGSIRHHADIVFEGTEISRRYVDDLLIILNFYSMIDSRLIDNKDTAKNDSDMYQKFYELLSRLISVQKEADIFYSHCSEYGFSAKRPESISAMYEQIKSTVIDSEGPAKLIRISIIKDEMDELGLLPFLEATLATKSSDVLGENMELAVIQKLSESAYGQFGSIISEFSGARLDQLRSEFQMLDRRLINQSSNEVLSGALASARPSLGVSRGKKSEYSDLGLIEHQLGLKRKMSPTKLVKRSIGALTEIHPCWMMVPTAVASFLPREEIFDLVVIDEASQMTPEHSISALMRAKQAVIVGDTNQLPPTNFFRAAADVEEEDGDVATIEESILELANTAFRPKHRLLWHYRSRHESLISFSNYYIYDNDLVIFPSPGGERDKMGVDLVRADGVYQSGINPVEATVVADAIVEFMENDSHRSLGVVTMNQAQMEQIDSMVRRHAETNLKISDYLEKWDMLDGGLQRFFVKNIENVQGDERDVIFISTVYGKDSLGKFRQAFGPINGSAGKRRLNVLFTRAKEKITTFTSIPLDQLNPGDHNEGAILLKRWLEYSGTGVVGERLRDSARSMFGPDSPFEEHVIEQIESLGYVAVPQVGVSNYFIDIGVRHPNYDLGYICGVECDGASYHSSKSARDRDVLRQEVLEGLGWNLYRIWSTDWFKNSKLQTERLKEYLDKKLEEKLKNQTLTVRPIEAAESSEVSEDINADANRDEKRLVTIGSKVVLEYSSGPRAGMRSKFVVVDTKSSASHTPGYDPLPVMSPLGAEVIDSQEGDIVSFEANGALTDVVILELLS
jgi:very-short-patch-repair endonuclease